MVDGPVPANPTWMVLMKVAIQEIMRTLEVPQDRSDCEEALKEIEKVVQDSLARAHQLVTRKLKYFVLH